MALNIEVVCRKCFERDLDATGCRLSIDRHTIADTVSRPTEDHRCEICGDNGTTYICHMYETKLGGA